MCSDCFRASQEKSTLEADLECPICFEIFDNAVETICGHAFCEFCLNKTIELAGSADGGIASPRPLNITCPVCKKDPRPIHSSYTLRRIVDHSGLARPHVHVAPALEEKELGNRCYQNGEYAEAIKHYISAIEQNSGEYTLYSNVAASYLKLTLYRMAHDYCDRCIALNPNFVKAYLRKAMCLEFERNFSEARITLEKARRIDNSAEWEGEISVALQRLSVNS